MIKFKVEQRKAEQKKYGIEYDDDYDYLQHLRDPCAPPEQYSVHVDKGEGEDEDEDYEDDDDDDDDDEEEEDDKDNVKDF